MKTYTVFIIPDKKFPNNLVIKRWRGEHTDARLKARKYEFFAYIERKTKKEARAFANKKYLLEKGTK